MIAFLAQRITRRCRQSLLSFSQHLHGFAAFGLVMGVVLLAGCSATERPRFNDNLLTPAVVPTRVNDGELAPLQPPDAVAGAALFADRCAACHGINGDGNGPQAPTLRAQGKVVANLVNLTRARSVKPTEWHQIITNGRIENLMPPFGQSLSAQQRWDVQAYMWALGTPSQTVTSGSALFAEQCAACHSAGNTSALSATAFTDLTWLANTSLLDISNGIAAHAAANEPHQAVKLTDAQRLLVADYVRTLAYGYADPVAIREAAVSGDGQILLAATLANTNMATLAGAAVTLRAYDTSGEVFSRTQSISANHVVSFVNLPRRADYFYQPEIVFEGVKFYGPAQQFVPTTTVVLTGLVPVFETTSDPGAISVPEMYYFVQDVTEATLSVVEVYFINNASNMAYVRKLPNGQTHSLHFSLPADARNVRFDPPQIASRYTVSGTDVYYNDVVEPGDRTAQVTVIYDVPYRSPYNVSRPMDYAVANASVLLPNMEAMPAGGTPITVTGLINKGLQNTPNGSFLLFQLDKPVAAGGAVSFQLSGQPRAVAIQGMDSFSIGLGLVALAVVLGGAYLLLTRVNTLQKADRKPINQQREDLLLALAELDRDHAAGKLRDAYYQERRAELKEALRQIWK